MSQAPIIGTIKRKLHKAFPGAIIEVIDNSPEHASHITKPDDSASTTHVKIQVFSEHFKEMGILERHKQIYEILKSEILHLHAISIDAKPLD